MSDILQVVGGAMLLCIPGSFVLTIFYMHRYEQLFGDMGFRDFVETLVLMYLCLLLFAAVGFMGVTGFAMMMGAFR